MGKKQTASIMIAILLSDVGSALAQNAIRIEGRVAAGGGPVANSTVTLWAATSSQPRQLAQTRTSSDGQFEVGSQESTRRMLFCISLPKVVKPPSTGPVATTRRLRCYRWWAKSLPQESLSMR